MDKAIARSALYGGTLPHAPGLLAHLRLWLDLWSERRALRGLDARLLEDIGIDAECAEREATRRPWDVPPARLDRS